MQHSSSLLVPSRFSRAPRIPSERRALLFQAPPPQLGSRVKVQRAKLASRGKMFKLTLPVARESLLAYSSVCMYQSRHIVSPIAVFRYPCSLLVLPARTYARSCFKTKPRKRRDPTKVHASLCSVYLSHCYYLLRVQVNPIKQKIASDIRDIFSRETVAVVHFGDLDTNTWSGLRLRLAETGNKAQVIPTKIATRALDNHPVQNITGLFQGSTALVYGDLENTDDLLSCIKTEPRLCLLGGKVLDKLFTPRGLEEVAKLPSLEVLRQELVALLCLPQRQTLSLLQSTPASLSQSLSLLTSSTAAVAHEETD